jgi:hypothetical protein
MEYVPGLPLAVRYGACFYAAVVADPSDMQPRVRARVDAHWANKHVRAHARTHHACPRARLAARYA